MKTSFTAYDYLPPYSKYRRKKNNGLLVVDRLLWLLFDVSCRKVSGRSFFFSLNERRCFELVDVFLFNFDTAIHDTYSIH